MAGQPDNDSIGSSGNTTASLIGTVTSRSSFANSPIPFIDFSDLSASHLQEVLPMPRNSSGNKQRGGVADPFPCRLHRMLSFAQTQGLENIVSWQPHGRSFHVHDWTALHHIIMPRFFGKSKVSTFRRQLYLYGFAGLKTGPDTGSFYHMMFLRHRPDLCPLIFRKSYAIAGPSTEPNLYTLPNCPRVASIPVSDTAASQPSECRTAPVQLPAASITHSKALATIHPSQAAVYKQCAHTQSNQMIRNTHPFHHETFKVSGDNDDAPSIKSVGHYMLTQKNFPHHDQQNVRGPMFTSGQALSVDPMRRIIDSTLPVSSFVFAAKEARQETFLDQNLIFDRTSKAPPKELDMLKVISPSASFKTDKNTEPELRGDVRPSVLNDIWSHSFSTRVAVAHSRGTEAIEALSTTLKNNDMLAEHGRATTGILFSLQEPHHEIDSDPHPSLETEQFSMLEPEPMTESELAACRHIASKRQQ